MTLGKKKLTVHIDEDDYNAFVNDLYHGQLTLIMQKFIITINEMIANGKEESFKSWVHGNKTLTLKQPKKKGT